MIDLINKSVDEINALIQKYASVLELIKPQYQPHMAVIIDWGISHINNMHNNLSVEWKAWTMVYLKRKFFKNEIHNESDVIASIDVFIKYYHDNYVNYIHQLGMIGDDFDKNYSFVCNCK